MDNSIYITFMRHGRFRADDEEVNEGRYDSLLTDVGRHRFRSWRMNHAPTPPIANPIAGPSTSSFRRNDTHCPPPPTSPVATAISTRITGSATMSFIPASILRTWRTERGIRCSLRISRRTTGSVDARMAPLMNATPEPNPISNANGTAPRLITNAVPEPKMRDGTSQRRPSSLI